MSDFKLDISNAAQLRFLALTGARLAGDSCWEWKGGTFNDGYGRFNISNRGVRAHRYSWTIHNGPIPSDAKVCHRCDNILCIEPEHLFLGTQADNMADMVSKGRSAKGSAHSQAILTEKQVTEIRSKRAQKVKLKDLAKEYGVSIATISIAAIGKTWGVETTQPPFVAGYVAALRASHPEIGDAPFSPETLARIREDCAALDTRGDGPRSVQQGRDFWATRQAGGASWSYRFPPLTVYLGDDGKVRFQ